MYHHGPKLKNQCDFIEIEDNHKTERPPPCYEILSSRWSLQPAQFSLIREFSKNEARVKGVLSSTGVFFLMESGRSKGT